MLNKFKVVLASLLMIFVLSCGILCPQSPAQSTAENCPECDLYTHEGFLPYLTADSGWWVGLAITNVSAEPALCRLDYICANDENSVQRLDIAPHSIAEIVVDIKSTSYAKLRASGPLFFTVMTGNGQMLHGSVQPLYLIHPAAAGTETGIAQ